MNKYFNPDNTSESGYLGEFDGSVVSGGITDETYSKVGEMQEIIKTQERYIAELSDSVKNVSGRMRSLTDDLGKRRMAMKRESAHTWRHAVRLTELLKISIGTCFHASI